MKVQDQILPWTKNGGGSVTLRQVIVYANKTRRIQELNCKYLIPETS